MTSGSVTSRLSAEHAVHAYRSRSAAEAVLPPLRDALENIDPWRPPPSSVMQVLCAIAAGWPELIQIGIARSLASVIDRSDLTGTHQPGLDEVFHVLPLLVSTPAAVALPDTVRGVFETPGVQDRWLRRAINLLADLNLWRPELITVDLMLDLAEAAGPVQAQQSLIDVVEEVILRDPASITSNQIRRLLTLSDEPFYLRFLLNALASHPETQPDVRDTAETVIKPLFPLRAAWNALAGGRPLQVLCVQNIADGQGDEIVRIHAILQALLDAHAGISVTLLTDRCYLWDHPRLRCISFDDRDSIVTVLNEPVDVLIECFEDNVLFLNHDATLHQALDQVGDRQQPVLNIAVSKRDNHFTLDSVRIAGQEWARALEVDTPRVSSVYDPMSRLIAELGLPLPHHDTQPPLWNRAEGTTWSTIVAGNREHRPVALVNPFGGSDELKGYSRRMIHQAGPLLATLVEQGYFVVVWPGQEPWSQSSIAVQACSRLPPEARRYCVIGPDPTKPVEGDDSQDNAARFIRLTLSCIQHADLIVTIEGWMEHAAFALGVPFRVLMASGSQGRQWLPWGRSRHQHCWLFPGEHQPDIVPLPQQPRKQALLALLARMDSRAWSDTLTLIVHSEDTDLRAAAARAFSRCNARDGQNLLLRLLSDSSGVVRGAAADGLLTCYPSALGTGIIPHRGVLEVHRLLAADEPDVGAVVARAAHAFPALHVTLYDDNPVKRRVAAALLEHIARGTAGHTQPSEEAAT